MSFLCPIPPAVELGINIDHIATIRNARGLRYPDLIQAALVAEEAGADLITLHLREDRRHIRDEDIKTILPLLRTRMNLEIAVTNEMLDFSCFARPHEVCFVPEKRQELTTEGGLNVVSNFSRVQTAIKQLHDSNINVSLFIDPDVRQVHAAYEAGALMVELHTGQYANAIDCAHQMIELKKIQISVLEGIKYGLKVNVGHGLHYMNVQLIAAIPGISALNIGHAIVAHALFIGWKHAVSEMKNIVLQACLQRVKI